jgi:hypothetical protein
MFRTGIHLKDSPRHVCARLILSHMPRGAPVIYADLRVEVVSINCFLGLALQPANRTQRFERISSAIEKNPLDADVRWENRDRASIATSSSSGKRVFSDQSLRLLVKKHQSSGR